MRLAGIILIGLIPMLIGLIMAHNSVKSLKQTESVIMLIDEMVGYISYQTLTLDEIMLSVAQSGRYELLGFNKWQKKEGSFANRVSEYIECNDCLKMSKEQQQALASFLSSLGQSNVEGQRQICDLYRQKFVVEKDHLQSDVPKKQKLCCSIGALAGIFAVILLI